MKEENFLRISKGLSQLKLRCLDLYNGYIMRTNIVWPRQNLDYTGLKKINRATEAQPFHFSNPHKWLPYKILCSKSVKNVQIDPQTTELYSLRCPWVNDTLVWETSYNSDIITLIRLDVFRNKYLVKFCPFINIYFLSNFAT